jgi:hypothetical protein
MEKKLTHQFFDIGRVTQGIGNDSACTRDKTI